MDWTPEAKEYLEGYLAQVRALARQSGEDADEIASELRGHIEREAEQEGGAPVSLDRLRQVLTVVGSPEEVASAESLLARSIGEGAARPDGGAPRAPIAGQAVDQAPTRRSRSGCWAAVLGLFLFAVLGVATLFAIGRFQWSQHIKGSIYAGEKSAITTLRQIVDAEERWLKEAKEDKDGDGVPDYGSLQDLTARAFVPEEVSTGVLRNFVFNLTLTPSAKSGKPAFECRAVPVIEEFPHQFLIDQSGNVQRLPTSSSPQDLERR